MQIKDKQEEILEIVRRMLHDPSVPDTRENHFFDIGYVSAKDNHITIAIAPKWVLTWPDLITFIHGNIRFVSVFQTCYNIVFNIDNYNSYRNEPIPSDKLVKMRMLGGLADAVSEDELLLRLAVIQ